jgi:hypothetical protein
MGIRNSSYGTPRADLGEAIAEFNGGDEQFVARQVFPVLDLPRQAATLSVLTRENTKRPVTMKRAPGDGFARLSMITEDKTYTCENYAGEAKLPVEDRWQYKNDFDAEKEYAEIAKRALLVEAEVRVATIVQSTSIFTGADLTTDVSSSAPWATTSSDVISTIIAAKQKVWANSGFEADALVCDHTQLGNLLANAGVRARFPGAAIITEDMLRSNLAAILGLKHLFVGAARYDNANENITYSGASCWSATYVNVFKLADGGPRKGGLGKTIRWSEAEEYRDQVYMYHEDQTASDIIQVKEYVDELLFDQYFGHMLKVA